MNGVFSLLDLVQQITLPSSFHLLELSCQAVITQLWVIAHVHVHSFLKWTDVEPILHLLVSLVCGVFEFSVHEFKSGVGIFEPGVLLF